MRDARMDRCRIRSHCGDRMSEPYARTELNILIVDDVWIELDL
jgi:hypothetical protein